MATLILPLELAHYVVGVRFCVHIRTAGSGYWVDPASSDQVSDAMRGTVCAPSELAECQESGWCMCHVVLIL